MAVMDVLAFVIPIGVTILGAAVQISAEKRGVSPSRKAEILLTWAFVCIVGFGGVWAFIGHTIFADQVAASIGWPAGNPFQQEVALADLSIGVLGLLSARITGSFRIATLISYAIFMCGAGMIHLWQIQTVQNYAVNNAGPVLWVDICMPFILIGLYILTFTLKKREKQPSLS
jgi:hypothetical protein